MNSRFPNLPRRFNLPHRNNPIEYNGHTYMIGDFIGSGCFGEVYECRDEWGNELVAKIISPKLGQYKQFLDRTIRETDNLFNLRHPNITYLYDAFELNNKLYLILERCDLTLEELIKHGQSSGDRALPYIAKDILQAVHFMHNNGYVHADLHPGNIFCSILRDQIQPNSQNYIFKFKIGDLGITKREADLNLNYLNTIFADWMRAPECIDQSFGSVDRRVDIYHIGLLLLSLTRGDIPRFTYQEIVDAVPRRMAEGLSSPYRDVIARTLRRHVDARTQTAFAVWKEIEEVLERIQRPQG
ncbi:MAG TPA: protein kinase family protein [Cyanobacteria bacterium UBA12227]|nr:protein kinase family protein [Cyanobacteria bacterium UBA12227]